MKRSISIIRQSNGFGAILTHRPQFANAPGVSYFLNQSWGTSVRKAAKGMAKLKPCPFCGSLAKRYVTDARSYCPGRYKIAIACTGSGCRAAIDMIYTPPSWVKNPERQAKATIAKAWNRRVESAAT